MQSQSQIPQLPTLDAEIYRLHADRNRRSVLASLVVDHALLNDGPVYWLDALNHAATDAVAAVAPSARILDRIQVARSFTPYQHHAIARSLPDVAATAEPPSLIVAPGVEAHYTDPGPGIDGDELLARTLGQLAALKREYECPVLLTTTGDLSEDHPAGAAVTAQLHCTQTKHGPRFESKEFETQVYPVGNGLVQTTIAYWQSVLEARQPLYSATGDPSYAKCVSV